MGICWVNCIRNKLQTMKRILIICLLVFISCEDFSVLEKDQENVFFFKNNGIINDEFSGQLSVATFNIKFGYCQTCDPFSGEIGGDFEQLDRIADLINSLDLDIVSLQEVGLDYDVTIVQNQAEYIASKTNMNFAYGMDRALQSGNNLFINGFWGNAILSKYEITDLENPTIRYIDYYNQNHSLKATIKLNEETEVIVLNSHFASGSTNQEKNIQISEINNLVSQINKPYIFTGDLNISYTGGIDFISQFYEEFDNSLELIDANERNEILNSGTFINGSVLDYIFTDKINFSVESGMLAPNESWEISDHYLYYVNLNKI